jgi:hypothetical protein
MNYVVRYVAVALLFVTGWTGSNIDASGCIYEDCVPLWDAGESDYVGEFCCDLDGGPSYPPPCEFLGENHWPSHDDLCADMRVDYLEDAGAFPSGEGDQWSTAPKSFRYEVYTGECVDGWCVWTLVTSGTSEDEDGCWRCA